MGGACDKSGKWEELENNKWEGLVSRIASGSSLCASLDFIIV